MPAPVAVALPRLPESRHAIHADLSDNERHILDRLRLAGTATRADLSRSTGLTVQSAVRLVDALAERGLVAIGASLAHAGRGKPGAGIALNPGYGHTVGYAIATDALSLALLDFSGQIRATAEHALRSTEPAALLAQLREADAALTAAAGAGLGPRLGAGVAMTGFFVEDGVHMNPPEPLRALGQLSIGDWLAEALGLPVWVDNDGTVAAAGESLLGIGRQYRDFAYLHFNYGLGGGVVIDGACLRGAHGNAGEFAGMLPQQGLERGTLELLRQLLAEDGIALPDIRALLAAYDPTWPAIERWIARVAPGLSLIVSAIVAIFDPQAVVFGGRMPRELATRLIPHVRIDNQPRRGQARPLPVLLPAAATADASAVGAAALPLKACYFR
ncbi:ROK family transcriptional regulator [Xanthomonas sp. CFBP 8445]|uniref:ROK family transcriptional regulator n=1 Tax=Xanthomonas sp. CFBP 8445 TaxID=2971236 RepID=UPI0021E040ED|nr:ROK family transcriptional regulator [Xanthomonas sp. CFBP 8445]UYC13110.1 ROK family transcriptional regulator [Xanthomonas sp. CFBP 8445]